MAKDEKASGGIGICMILFLIFMVLKLCHYIDWSWWWVASPLWIPVAVVLLFCLFCCLMLVIFKVMGK